MSQVFRSKDLRVKIVIVYDDAWGQYKAEWYENNDYDEGKTNYSDDMQDIVGTAELEIKQYDEQELAERMKRRSVEPQNGSHKRKEEHGAENEKDQEVREGQEEG